MQARLSQKDETLQKYQELLHQARDDATVISRRYEEELKQMQAKLHDRNDAAFAKFKQAIQSELNKPPTQAPTNKQVWDNFITVYMFSLSAISSYFYLLS